MEEDSSRGKIRNRKKKQKNTAHVTTDDTPDNDTLCDTSNPPPEKEATVEQSNVVTLQVPRWLFRIGCLILVIIAVYFCFHLTLAVLGMFYGGYDVPADIMEDLGMDGVVLFRTHDRDDDGFLSIEEFEPLAHMLLDTNVSYTYNLSLEETDEVVTLHAMFKPLVLSSMTGSNSVFTLPGKLDALHGLQNWKSTNIDKLNLAAKHFFVFMPEDFEGQSSLGKVYEILTFPGKTGSPLSSNRYYPPRLGGTDIVMHTILTMFHPRPFIHMRFAPQGGAACIRAYNDHYLDIVFRIHAEFQLNKAPYYPFWFTPSQFTGHLIVNKAGSHVKYFHMYVPADRQLNVDMEWLNGPREADSMAVDIGYCPKMEVKLAAPSRPAVLNGVDYRNITQTDTNIEEIASQMKWTEEISFSEALKNLELKFYPFKKVEYHNFTEVFPRAREENKLVHQVLLWGALDDQSC